MYRAIFGKKHVIRLLGLLFLVCLFCGCVSETILITPDAYLEAINDLAAEDFGALTVTEAIDRQTYAVRISDRLQLTLYADSTTGYLQHAELMLTFDADITQLDYATFHSYFLLMLKAYDPDITISNINAIHNALDMGNYEVGLSHTIGYGSSDYSYTVSEDGALFSALLLPASGKTE